MPFGLVQLTIGRLWDGRPAPAHARVGLSIAGLGDPFARGLDIEFSAPFHGDLAPGAPPGRFDTLWEYEVVELFLANGDGSYLELEFGPHGHHLALRFEGERHCVDRFVSISPQIELAASRWSARCRVPPTCLPPGVDRLNAFAVFGAADARTHLAYAPSGGARPDFHTLSSFVPFARLAARSSTG